MASRLHRLIRIIRSVRAKGYPNVQELCSKLQIKERTLFNDLKELKEDLGIEIQFDRNRRGYFLASSDAEISLMALSDEVAVLSLLAIDFLSSHAGEEIVKPLRDTFNDEIALSLNLKGDRIDSRTRLFALPIELEQKLSKHAKHLFVEISRSCLLGTTLHVTLTDGELHTIRPQYFVHSFPDWRLAYLDLGLNSNDEAIDGSSKKALAELSLSSIQTVRKLE